MASLMGSIFNALVQRYFNSNPEVNSDILTTTRGLDKFDHGNVPVGFTKTIYILPSGVKMERIARYGVAPSGKVVFFLHGGAYMARLNDIYRTMAADFIRVAGKGVTVFLLDYDVAPEHVYPTQLDQAVEAWCAVVKMGFDPADIVVGGDSAGGNLALGLMLYLRDNARPMPCGGLCISPWADMTASGASYIDNYGVDVMFGIQGATMTEEKRLTLLDNILYQWTGEADRTHPYVSPVFGDYRDFPPMFFTVGGAEMLLDDTRTIVAKLQQAGCTVQCIVRKDMFHVYPLFHALIPEAAQDYRAILHWLKEMLALPKGAKGAK